MGIRFRHPFHWVAGLSYHQIITLGLSLGLVLSVGLFYSVSRQEYTYAVANFHLEARAAAAAVQQTLEYSAHDFASARSLYLASSEVTRSEFNNFVTDQLASNPLPGLMALEWIPYVPAAQRHEYEQAAQADGFPQFRFTERDKEGRLVTAPERAEYYPVYYVAPQSGLEYILGFNLGSDATRLATLQQARDTAQPTVSGPVELVQSPTDAKGSLIFLPIYEGDTAPETVEERRRRLRGFLLGVFDLQSLLTADPEMQTSTGYDLYLVEPTQPPAEQLIFFKPAGGSATAPPGSFRDTPAGSIEQLQSGVHYAQEVKVGDRTWQLIVAPGPGQLKGSFSFLPLITMLAVFAFSALGTAYMARRRQVQDLLQKSEEQYRLVVENISDVIWAADAASRRLTFVTPSIRKLRGVSAEKTMQQSLEELLSPESMEQMKAVLPQRLAAVTAGFAGPYVEELALLRVDGSLVWTETTSHYAIEPRTQRLHIYGISRDNTERRRIAHTQAAQFAVNRILAQSPELQEAIVQVLESLTVGMDWLGAEFWQRTQDGSRLIWAAGWCRPDRPLLAQFLRQSAAHSFTLGQGLVGRTWQEQQAFWENNLDGHPEYPRHAIGVAAGLKSAVCVPVCIGDETLGVMVFHDASARPVDDWLLDTLVDLGRQIGQFIARKLAEIELQSERALLAERVQERTADLSTANAELAHAVRAKDEFLANMSHELRTPLNGILTLSESLQEGTYGSLNNRQLRSMHMISQSGNHLLTLINDVLDLAKVEAGKLNLQFGQVTASAVSQASLALVQEMASKKSIRLSFCSNDSEAKLQADALRLKQILVNLLSNAIKFTSVGGQVELEVTVRPEAGEIEFAVQDNGIGITPADQARLFHPFTQLDASLARHYEGTGLGLALVRRLVELHQGRVGVESTGIGGQGSRFIVSLPWEGIVLESSSPNTLSDGAPAQGPASPVSGEVQTPLTEGFAPAASEQATQRFRAKILVVDDNELNLLALEDYLLSAGFELSFANDGEQALEQAQAIQPDLILMDIQMPKMSGVEAIHHLRANPRFTGVPILALTALAMPGDRELCLEAGANDYITKPFLLRDLVKSIEGWLERARQNL